MPHIQKHWKSCNIVVSMRKPDTFDFIRYKVHYSPDFNSALKEIFESINERNDYVIYKRFDSSFALNANAIVKTIQGYEYYFELEQDIDDYCR